VGGAVEVQNPRAIAEFEKRHKYTGPATREPTKLARLKMDVIVRGRALDPQMTYRVLGLLLGLSRERVRQLHSRSIKCERYWAEFDEAYRMDGS
jgi:DNA-directed RNA polymerase sigma subunit (sigma70/sigma32)